MTDRLSDELALRTLVARYADAVARNDVPTWRSTWAEDAEWELLGQTLRGRDELVAYYEQVVSSLEAVVQHAHGGILEFQAADRATGRWSITEHARMASGAPLFTIGLYEDDYVRLDDEWLFSRRVFRTLYLGPPDLSVPFKPLSPPA
ncbi:MAG: nuclear transport factor 2 family protein [Myxococcota bacterium]